MCFPVTIGVGGITGQATAQASQAAAQASQNVAQATQANTQILNTINSTLTRTSNQLANIFQSLEGNFRTLTTQMSNLIQSLAGFKSAVNFGAPITAGRRRSGGGTIPKFANGGRVYGPSHAAGGVIAELEGGEYVIPKKYVKGTPRGGVQGRKGAKNAYVFDFDDTLATTKAKGFKDFNDPSFIRGAQATRYASLAKRRARQGDDIHVLTARFGSQGIIKAIQNFMKEIGAPAKSIIAVGGAFKNEREPGKRPGTTRKIGTATKKAKILANLAKRYNAITFLDDNLENLVKASEVKGVRSVEAQKGKLFKGIRGRAAGGFIKGYQPGGRISGIAINTQKRLQKQGISGTLPLGGGEERLSGVNPQNFLQPVTADVLRKADGDDFGAAVLRPGDFRATFTGQNDPKEISSI